MLWSTGVKLSEHHKYVFLRYNLPVPQEESMKSSVVEARLRTKLRESFQVRNDTERRKKCEYKIKRSYLVNAVIYQNYEAEFA